MKIWLDGGVRELEQATVSVLDHGLLYGDGVFEGIRVMSGKIADLDRHLDRLELSARAIYLTLPHGRSELVKLVCATVAAHGQADAYVRLLVTRGVGRLGIDTTSCVAPTLLCVVDSFDLYGTGLGSGLRL